jgi:flagellar basal-body rod protein FlgB
MELSNALLENYLRLTAAREEIISSNIANIDTPGYRTRDINFESELNSAMNAASLRTADGTEIPQMLPVVRHIQGLMERPDGNNVSLEREGLAMAETQLRYALAIQLLTGDFHDTLSAINGGS